jgi:hypothetical protein
MAMQTQAHAINVHAAPHTTGEFRRFWLAAAISNLGDGIRLAALPLLALELTKDARLIAGVTAASFLPWMPVHSCLGPAGLGVLSLAADARWAAFVSLTRRGQSRYGQWRHPLSQHSPRASKVAAVRTNKPVEGSM